ncbi:acyl-CoA dehydrogenase family protein [Rhodococcus sp. T7]|uniref:acyl-CoA dehydrogenase family protein n=1 Tax=Rhodococcus sp. T7 TaxID=627444 RepID=UPI001357EFE2|nr:acyl-CoA dehydrogenase family protein [Rhodococcus sp. T7]KAF0958000.1 Acyl-CoA dehydrogenase FadE27 [Rhodococcus sp. T7]KAF0960159.1 Acyl-CoA dehydrogenase FadE27 [Rhodococcus sp. T7]
MTDAGALLYSPESEDLRSALRAMLSQHCDWTEVLARTELADTADHVWKRLTGEMGCAGLPIPEDRGGHGASWSETAVVVEELGRAVADVPFLTSAVIALAVLQGLGDSDMLGQIADGSLVAAVAAPWPRLQEPSTTKPAWSGGNIQGDVSLVAGAIGADVLLVPAGDALIAVDPATVQIHSAIAFDQTRPLADLHFENVEGRVLAAGPQVAVALNHAATIGVAMIASEQLGIAERCLELTVQHALRRTQFGRLIGSYQAVKHRLADVWVSIVEAKAVARYAANCAAENSPDLAIASSLAHVVCSRAALRATQEMIQVHGGIGFTWEHPAHLYLKRARANATALGTEIWHRRQLGVKLGLTSRDGHARR